MKKINYCVVSHTAIGKNKTDNPGPGHSLAYHLEREKQPYLFIRHSIYNEGITFITFFDGINRIEKIIEHKPYFGELGIRLLEGWITFTAVFMFFKKSEIVYIGEDPLNAFWGLILKKMNKVRIFITFNPDYTKTRYPNYLLNIFYHFLDKLTNKNSDIILAVSKRILDIRRRDGIPSEKLVWIPNSPAISRTKKLVLKSGNPNKLIVVSARKSVSEFIMLLNAMEILIKDIPRIRLTFVCLPLMEKKIKALVKKKKLQKNILFLGSMSHDELFKIIASHGIGLAFYVNSYSGEYYMDSMKARDYLALGLPVIISGDNGTADDIVESHAGINIKANEKELISAIKKIVENKKLYLELRANALELASERDIEKILNKTFERISIEYSRRK